MSGLGSHRITYNMYRCLQIGRKIQDFIHYDVNEMEIFWPGYIHVLQDKQ